MGKSKMPLGWPRSSYFCSISRTIFIRSLSSWLYSFHVKQTSKLVCNSGTKLQIQNWFNWSWSNSSREMWCHVISLHGAANLIELSAEKTYEQYLSMPKNSTKGLFYICQFRHGKLFKLSLKMFLCLLSLVSYYRINIENGWKNSPTNYEHLWVLCLFSSPKVIKSAERNATLLW